MNKRRCQRCIFFNNITNGLWNRLSEVVQSLLESMCVLRMVILGVSGDGYGEGSVIGLKKWENGVTNIDRPREDLIIMMDEKYI